jgi:hypothetical protein
MRYGCRSRNLAPASAGATLTSGGRGYRLDGRFDIACCLVQRICLRAPNIEA